MFSDRLFQLRNAKGVTQADVAHAIGSSPATIGNYEQGTRTPRKQEVWDKLADYFDVTVDFLQGKTDIPHTEEQQNMITNQTPPKHLPPFHQYLQYRKDIPIYFNGINITSLVFTDDTEIELTHEHMNSYVSFDIQSNHVLFARRMLLTILSEIKETSIEDLITNLSEIVEKLEDFVIYEYKIVWNNIDNLFPKVDSLESLHHLLSACIAIDTIAQKQYSLVPLDEEFDWLYKKLRKPHDKHGQ